MKVSIVIPVYNVSLYIERCLYSVLRQSYSDIECVIVDDASPDDSMEKVNYILQEQDTSFKFEIVSHSINRGLSAARNTGVENSTGEYIYFLDSDDEITPNCIETLVSYLDEFYADIVIGELSVVGDNRKKYSPLLIEDKICLKDQEILDAYLKREWYEMAWNKLVRRDMFFEKGCWFREGIVHEDNLWSFYVAINASYMIVSKVSTYIYYIHPGAITSEKQKHHFDSMLIIMDEMIKNWKKTNYPFSMNRNFCNYIFNSKIYFMKSLLKGKYGLNFVKEEYFLLHEMFENEKLSRNSLSLSFCIKDLLLEFILNYQLRKSI